MQLTDLESLGVPAGNIAEYFQPWLIHEPTFRAAVARLQGYDLRSHVSSATSMAAVDQQRSAGYSITRDGIAEIEVRGVTMKNPSSLSGGTSTRVLRQQLQHARRNPAVLGVLISFDTPGGSVAGNSDLAEAVAELAATKCCYAFVEDMCCSAGVAVASQASKRFANHAQSIYGSLGTYSVLSDYSGQAEKLGIRVHVIRATGATYKGMGEVGAPVTDAHLAELQRIVDALNGAYLGQIAKGVKQPIANIEKLADGRVIFAADAVKSGLITGIQSYEQTYEQLVRETKQRSSGTLPSSQPSSALPPAMPAQSQQRSSPVSEQQQTREQQASLFVAKVESMLEQHPHLPRQKAIRQVALRFPSLHQSFIEESSSQINAKQLRRSYGR